MKTHFKDIQEVKEFANHLSLVLCSQGFLDIANEIQGFSSFTYTTTSEYFGELRITLKKMLSMPIEVKLCAKRFRNWQEQSVLGLPIITLHEIRHSSSTYKLRISGGDTKSVQGDTGHSKADTLINTYSHVEDLQRMQLTNTIEKDFYGDDTPNKKSSDIDIVSLIQNDPELRKKALSALLAGIT